MPQSGIITLKVSITCSSKAVTTSCSIADQQMRISWTLESKDSGREHRPMEIHEGPSGKCFRALTLTNLGLVGDDDAAELSDIDRFQSRKQLRCIDCNTTDII